VRKDAFFMENANLLKAPGYGLVNLNLHYDTEVAHDYLKGAVVFFEVKNVFDKTYVASANNITDSINAVTGVQNPGSVLATTGTGSIYAGCRGPLLPAEAVSARRSCGPSTQKSSGWLSVVMPDVSVMP
jgi:hypothetical protein